MNINLRTKPEFIFDKNPSGKVPTIEFGDRGCLYESLIVCDYMDEVYPDVSSAGDGSNVDRLNSKDPLQRAKDRILLERFNSVTSLDNQLLMLSPESKDEDIKALLKAFVNSLTLFEVELELRGTKFFGGMYMYK